MTSHMTVDEALGRGCALHRRAQRAEAEVLRLARVNRHLELGLAASLVRVEQERQRRARAEAKLAGLTALPLKKASELAKVNALRALARDAVELPRLLTAEVLSALEPSVMALLRRIIRSARYAGLSIPEASAIAVAPRLHEILRSQCPAGPGDER